MTDRHEIGVRESKGMKRSIIAQDIQSDVRSAVHIQCKPVV